MFGIQLTVNYVHPLPIVPKSAVLWMPWKICWIGPLLGYQRNLREDKVMEEEATEEERTWPPRCSKCDEVGHVSRDCPLPR